MRLPIQLIALGLAAPAILPAQPGTAKLRGTVSDASTARPIPGVRVVIGASGRMVVTDSSGTFELGQLPSGILRFYFSAEGFPRASIALAFAPDEVMVRRFELDSSLAAIAADTIGRRRDVQVLPTEKVTVTAPRGVRYADFERRLKTGRGQYVTREQIDAARYNTLTDAVRTMRGVNVDCVAGPDARASGPFHDRHPGLDPG